MSKGIEEMVGANVVEPQGGKSIIVGFGDVIRKLGEWIANPFKNLARAIDGNGIVK